MKREQVHYGHHKSMHYIQTLLEEIDAINRKPIFQIINHMAVSSRKRQKIKMDICLRKI